MSEVPLYTIQVERGPDAYSVELAGVSTFDCPPITSKVVSLAEVSRMYPFPMRMNLQDLYD